MGADLNLFRIKTMQLTVRWFELNLFVTECCCVYFFDIMRGVIGYIDSYKYFFLSSKLDKKKYL